VAAQSVLVLVVPSFFSRALRLRVVAMAQLSVVAGLTAYQTFIIFKSALAHTHLLTAVGDYA
jgi:hypothetical protein